MAETIKGGMQLASQLSNQIVMEQAVKDKTEMVQKQMEAEANAMNQPEEEEYDEEEAKSEDDDSDFNDDDDIIRTLRDQRLNEIKAQNSVHQENLIAGHGQYNEITEEQFLPAVTKTKFVVVAFYHKDFERCKIMDHHLRIIAKQHTETRFVNIDAEKCPFFVTKLQIQMLPTVICFMDGIAFDRICGFEELGGIDEFPTLVLTRRLVKTGCIKALNKKEKGDMVIRKKGRHESSDSDSDQ